jgi:hypothetical protein
VDDLIAVVVGFALTTVLGGWWAARLQTRSWRQQNEVRLREQELDRAGATCASTMSLLDQRLYRMQRLLWAATSSADAPIDVGELEVRRQEYLKVLFDWNDRLNTNLSLVGSHFGDDARSELEHLYEAFKRVGRDVENVVRAALAGEDTSDRAVALGEQFEGRDSGSLNDGVYRFGLTLMSQLRDGDVGRQAPNLPMRTHSPHDDPDGPRRPDI